jgi:hypothetical protein
MSQDSGGQAQPGGEASVPLDQNQLEKSHDTARAPLGDTEQDATQLLSSCPVDIEGLMDGSIVFDRVYSNGLHALKRIFLRNTLGDENHVSVTLGSSLGDQLAFQLENENLPEDLGKLSSDFDSFILHSRLTFSVPAEGNERFVTTNTVESARAGGSYGSGPKGREYNALFNSIRHVTRVNLAPGESKPVILVFKPDTSHTLATPITHSPTSEAVSQFPSRADSVVSSNELAVQNDRVSSISIAGDSSSSDDMSLLRTRNRQVAIKGFVTFDVPNSATSSSTIQQISVPFHATACRSFFTLSACGHDDSSVCFDFGDAVSNETYIREFNIINQSDIELFWALDDPDGYLSGLRSDPHLVLVDVEKGHWIGTHANDWPRPAPIPSYGSRKIRLAFRSGIAREVDFEFALENLQDSRNSIQVQVRASVASSKRDESLVVMAGQSLDFGDCVAGAWSRQLFVLKNVSESLMDVSFVAEPGYEVTFELFDGSGLSRESSTPLSPSLASAFGPNSVGNIVSDPSSIRASARASRPRFSNPTEAHASVISELTRQVQTGFRSSSLLAGAVDTPLDPDQRTQSRLAESVASVSELGSASRANTEASSDDGEGRYDPVTDYFSSLSTTSRSGSRPPSRARARDQQTHVSEESSAELSSMSSPSGGPVFRVADHLRGIERQHLSLVEDIVSRPGVEYRIIVCYRPAKASEASSEACKLLKCNFKITLSYRRSSGLRDLDGSEQVNRKTISCKARACTSFISVEPKCIDFGEATVGAAKHVMVAISNLSEITARVDLRYVSKVLSAFKGEIAIPPLQKHDVRLDLFPRRVSFRLFIYRRGHRDFDRRGFRSMRITVSRSPLQISACLDFSILGGAFTDIRFR